VGFSPDGKKIVAGVGNTVTVWDADGGREMKTLKGHTNMILSVAFSPTGSALSAVEILRSNCGTLVPGLKSVP